MPGGDGVATTRFEQVTRLGEGAFCDVFRVYDLWSGEYRALRAIKDKDPRRASDLRAEFRTILARRDELTHENLVRLYDLVESAPEAPFGGFTMEPVVDEPEVPSGVAGESFTLSQDVRAYVRGAGDVPRSFAVILERTDGCLQQLYEGLVRLHRARIIHRDLKPSNLLVRRDAAEVYTLKILDFGFSLDLERDDVVTSLAGTAPYLAPEVFRHPGSVSEAADWFSVGALLYELLTGAAPYVAPELARATFRERCSALQPAKLARTYAPLQGAPRPIPAELCALVEGLLDPSPASRAGADDVGRYLHRARVPARPSFVGREDERGRLRRALDEASQGRQVVVSIEGPAGIGKTALVRQFLRESRGRARVFSGACSLHEQVSYRLFSSIIDQVARHLQHRPFGLRDLSYRDELVRTFPALGAVPGLSPSRSSRPHDDPEEHEVRRRAFVAFCELVELLANEELPLLLWFDNVHQADRDSLPLLKMLLHARPPSGGRRALLLVFTARAGDAAAQAPEGRDASVAALLGDLDARTVTVRGLSARESDELARQELPEVDTATVARDSGGSPLYIRHLCRHVRDTKESVLIPAGASLAEVLRRRFEALHPAQQRLVTLVAVADRPLDFELIAAMLDGEMTRVTVRRHLDALTARSFLIEDAVDADRGASTRPILRRRELRRASAASACCVETAHQSIQAVALDHSDRALYERFAAVLSRDADPHDDQLYEDLSRAQESAGDVARAAESALRAAAQASDSLAFDRAVRLYDRALRIGGAAVRTVENRVAHAEALANAGRGTRAARAYEEAARLLEDAKPTSLRSRDLRRRAAAQYLGSGRHQDGIRALHRVLESFGVSLPASDLRAMVLAAKWQIQSRFTSFRRAVVGPRRPPTEEATRRLEALWTAVTGFSMVRPAYAFMLVGMHLDESLRAGDIPGTLRALGYRAVVEASLGDERLGSWEETLCEAEQRARKSASPYDHAWVSGARGASLWLRARWGESLNECERATAIFRGQCRGAAWEAATGERYILSDLALLGRLQDLSQRLPKVLRDAEDRDDLYAAEGCRVGHVSVLWLAQDRPSEARQMAREAARSFPLQEGHMGCYHHLLSEAQIALYEGDVDAAHECVEAKWGSLHPFRAMEYPKADLLHLRARCAVATAARATREAAGGLHGLAVRCAEEMSPVLPVARAYAASIRAAVAHQTGRHADALRELAAAEELYRGANMALHGAATAWCRSALEDGARATSARRASEGWFALEGVVCPSALVATIAPGFGAWVYKNRAAP